MGKQSDGCAATWPEQDAVDQWWEDHRYDLKVAVTEFRLSIQDERDRFKEALEKIVRLHNHEVMEDKAYEIAKAAIDKGD